MSSDDVSLTASASCCTVACCRISAARAFLDLSAKCIRQRHMQPSQAQWQLVLENGSFQPVFDRLFLQQLRRACSKC